MQKSTETLWAMRHQEEVGYTKRDFLHQQEDEDETRPHCCPIHLDIDIDCRFRMCKWCYQICKFCKYDRETVEIAMSYLDRFVSTEFGAAALHDRNIYQLASMTTIYTAIKIHEREALSPRVVSQLSRGIYTAAQIEEMEAIILAALEWRMNPPSAMSFVQEFLKLLPQDVLSERARETVLELTAIQAELSVSDYAFIETPASTIAYCSFMNALDSMEFVFNSNNDANLSQIGFILAESIGLDSRSDHVLDAQTRLYAAVDSQHKESFHSSVAAEDPVQKHGYSRHASFEESPRAVSGQCLVKS